MRGIITFIVGLYLTVALVVGVAGAWAFISDKVGTGADCTPTALNVETGATNASDLEGGVTASRWVPYVLWRAVIWPKAYFDEQAKADGVVDWLMVGYDPFGDHCR